MIISYFNLTLYRKKDILMIEKILKERQISAPILITELEDSYRINITSDYEHWELDDKILKLFPGYEFTDNIGNGRKSIRIKVSREQSSNSIDGWGRPIENPINEVKFLIKKSVVTPMQFNPKIRVLFDDESREYYINILPLPLKGPVSLRLRLRYTTPFKGSVQLKKNCLLLKCTKNGKPTESIE